MGSSSQGSSSSLNHGSVVIHAAIISSVASLWFWNVSSTVLEPYLDEVFHIRQATAYLENKWDVWDSKITTPPGLYLVSYAWLWLLRLLRVHGSLETLFRSLNMVGSTLGIYLGCILILRNRYSQARSPQSITKISHVAMNVVFFPPLFFFSSLFYTDAVSAVSVLAALYAFQSRNMAGMTVASLAALLMRQTNIFWTAIYLGAQELLRSLPRSQNGGDMASTTLSEVVHGSWDLGHFFDPLIREAGVDDYLKMVLSLCVSTVASSRQLIPRLIPYISLLAMFGSFVIWNGGVVLGDKSNHVASIHLPQMLYIWPYLTFFSWPILLPASIDAVLSYLGIMPSGKPKQLSAVPKSGILTILFSMFLALLAIHYNTLVHPFTLADNRHYTFYVFRLLLCHSAIKYIAAPIYLLCAWSAITALGGRQSPLSMPSAKSFSSSPNGNRISFVMIWLATSTLSLITAPLVEPRYFILPWLTWRLHVAPDNSLHDQISSSTTITITSARTKAAKSTSAQLHTPTPTPNPWLLPLRNFNRVVNHPEHALWLETAWYLAVNLATGWMFLRSGFEWPQEPGKVQRFMW